jgi:hypothetical protein
MRSLRFVSLLAATVLIAAGGCDSTALDPFAEEGGAYSIFGYVNARADTQFVRVEALKNSALTGIAALDTVDVRLTHVGSGRTVPLRDSVFEYPGGRRAHNFYVTDAAMSIEPQATYRLSVSGPRGPAARSPAVTVPRAFPKPTVETEPTFPDGPPVEFCPAEGVLDDRSVGLMSLQIRGVERLAAVKTRFTFARGRNDGVYTYAHLDAATHSDENPRHVDLPYGRDYCYATYAGAEVLQKMEVIVVAGHAEWPRFLRFNFEERMLASTVTNIEGGVGMFGAVLSDTLVVYS